MVCLQNDISFINVKMNFTILCSLHVTTKTLKGFCQTGINLSYLFSLLSFLIICSYFILDIRHIK